MDASLSLPARTTHEDPAHENASRKAEAHEPAESAAASSAGPARLARVRTAALVVARRTAYWTPVFAALVMFGQVTFLGLRPALREAERLEAAEVVVDARHQAALAKSGALALELRARADPIYRERQRRWRVHPPARG